MKLTKKQAMEKIKKLQEYVENIEDPKSRYAEVQFSKRADVLLEDKKDNFSLISTWDKEEDLNDFEWFEKEKTGHAFIRGNVCPFEMIDKKGNVLLKSDERLDIRFLKEKS